MGPCCRRRLERRRFAISVGGIVSICTLSASTHSRCGVCLPDEPQVQLLEPHQPDLNALRIFEIDAVLEEELGDEVEALGSFDTESKATNRIDFFFICRESFARWGRLLLRRSHVLAYAEEGRSGRCSSLPDFTLAGETPPYVIPGQTVVPAVLRSDGRLMGGGHLPCSNTAEAVHQERVPKDASTFFGFNPGICATEEAHSVKQILGVFSR